MAYELPKRLLCGKCGMSFPIQEAYKHPSSSKGRCSEPNCRRPHYDGVRSRGQYNAHVFMTPSQAREWLDSR